ncbi:MAG: hypothetical protein HFJ69_04415 [Enterorhabdus sp.]|nr:hypothetical protein [Enterorhabdus sp.]
MIDVIRYVNSIGEEIAFGDGCWHYGETDIFDTSRAHRSIGGRITGFEEDIREMHLRVELEGPEEERKRLADVTSYDVRTGRPGRLWANGCSMSCWIPGISSSDWHQLDGMYTAELGVVSDDPVWVRAASVTLESRDDLVVGGLDHPHDYPHDYLYSSGASVVLENPFRLPAKCDIYIPGPCADPYVIIAGNRYQVLGSIERGQLLAIRGYGDREIVVRHSDGTERSLFDRRVTEDGARPFAEIPVGRSVASWSGSYNVEVVMYEERCSPW